MTVAALPIPRLEQMLWMADYPQRGAQRFPQRAAIIGDHGSFTYEELDQACNRFAAYLDRSGIRAGNRIAYLGKNSELFFPVMFGCLRTGVVLVPINWRCTADEIAFVLADSGATLLICAPEFVATAELSIAGLTPPPTLLVTDGAAIDLRRLVSEGTSSPRRQTDPDACAMQMYTSGTTGKPKGVMMSHRALSIQRWVDVDSPEWADWNDDEIVLSAMPNFHIGGLSWMLIGLWRSLTCILTADASPANMLTLIKRYQATRTFVVPAALVTLLDMVAASGEPAPPLKGIFYGAAPMNVDLLKRCIDTFGCRFGQFYGMTENCGSATFLGPSSHRIDRPELLRSVGRVFPGMAIEIRDNDRRPCPTGTAGEIWVSSATMMLGYYHRPEATAEVLIDGWYRSGDGGYLNEAGYLYLTDRIKDVIISGGENIYPIEVENALRLHPAIRDVVVVGLTDPQWGEVVTAVVEWNNDVTATLDELRELARKQIAGYKLPKKLQSVKQLPRTATGKLQRGEVRKMINLADKGPSTQSDRPR